MDDVIRSFANNTKWSFRQLFVFFCENIFKEKAYENLDALSNDLLPKLFLLREDKVPNIRVCLARVISTYILNLEYFTNCKNSISNELETTIELLNKDKENDVRSYFTFSEETNEETSLPPYEDLMNYKDVQDKENTFDEVNTNLNEYEITNDDRLNDSLNLINNQAMNYDNTEDVELEEDDDTDDDEIIDTTKVGQLKIVNELDNDMEDGTDEIIDTSPHTIENISIKNADSTSDNSNVSYLNNHLDSKEILRTNPLQLNDNEDEKLNSNENS